MDGRKMGKKWKFVSEAPFIISHLLAFSYRFHCLGVSESMGFSGNV